MQHANITGTFSMIRTKSPPPAHQQASPITPVKKQYIFVGEHFIEISC